MNIMICGSMSFAKEMLETQKQLEELGHKAEVSLDTQQVAGGEHDNEDLEADCTHCIKTNVMRESFKQIEKSDAILVLNYPKNNIKGYIGTSSLMEIGLAYHYGKKIFLLHEPPHFTEHRWAHEIKIIQPKILNGDLTKI
ncbi:hypothetical protein KY319_05095 [Candidatus Woesearchaeota archaeon]|nr:hypothetical protein [Candidatus Woesearchaeota archaeon]